MASKDTVVLGAGVVGVATAWYLAEQGRRVTVIDRRALPAMETSFANAGMVAPGHSYTWASPQALGILWRSLRDDSQALRLKIRFDPDMWAWLWKFMLNCTIDRTQLNTARKLSLCLYSQDLLQRLTTTQKLQYDRISCGALYLYRDEISLARAREKMRILTNGGVRLDILNADEVLKYEPALTSARKQIAGAIYCPGDESGDARMFTLALMERCRESGVNFMMDAQVQSIEANANKVIAVHTNLGVVTGDDYVLALGSYSPHMARPLGYRLPVYPVKGYSITFPTDQSYQPPTIAGVDENNLVAWARFGNRLRFTATAEFSGYDTDHKPSDFAPMLRVAKLLFPDGADYEHPEYWAGLRPMTPEGTPILGKSRHKNLYFNTGHGHMGWTMACGTAKIVADIMNGCEPPINITGMTLR
ncbi:D-amino acid dehydrogenase [Acidithiobacillus thiooxidans]|uniref:D-amino acid dehydrogenase n=1 Tax=Acidithiobacillus thiooxidans TaxID=930 RepID=UPI001C0771AB|nr:D-amino acid dehydrogenase [Acidithiobacillus thiooxidans]MBU2750747.1 D-amino acid dehydrogenase [Acidithiobacillus thiooxidans]